MFRNCAVTEHVHMALHFTTVIVSMLSHHCLQHAGYLNSGTVSIMLGAYVYIQELYNAYTGLNAECHSDSGCAH